MTRYAAFLRGVNVGGVNLKMADVVRALNAAGFDDARTVLASGNVVFTSSGDVAVLRRRFETALRDRFDYEAWALIYDLATVRTVVEGYPFEPEVAGHHSYVTFVGDPEVLGELAALAEDADVQEKIAPGDGVLYWQVPKSGTLGSTIGKTMGKRRYKSTTTTRNLRTLGKVLERSR